MKFSNNLSVKFTTLIPLRISNWNWAKDRWAHFLSRWFPNRHLRGIFISYVKSFSGWSLCNWSTFFLLQSKPKVINVASLLYVYFLGWLLIDAWHNLWRNTYDNDAVNKITYTILHNNKQCVQTYNVFFGIWAGAWTYQFLGHSLARRKRGKDRKEVYGSHFIKFKQACTT